MKDCIQIGCGDLKVWVAEHGKRYTRSRFDWTGFIPQVSLRGLTFCAAESYPGGPPGSGGEGLCNEFKADDFSMGWDESDEFFLKPGAGLLKKVNDKPYFFYTNYEVIKPFPCVTQAGNDYVNFRLGAIDFKGLAYTINKHVAVLDNALIITTTLDNIGEKALAISEYNHNFLSMNGTGVHPSLTLSVNKGYQNKNETPGLIKNAESIGFGEDFGGSFMITCNNPVTYAPKRWELRDQKAKMTVQEWGDFDVKDYSVWGTRHVISPEVFGDFSVGPGKSQTWTRMWKFYDER
jgi:hypothetical protein